MRMHRWVVAFDTTLAVLSCCGVGQMEFDCVMV